VKDAARFLAFLVVLTASFAVVKVGSASQPIEKTPEQVVAEARSKVLVIECTSSTGGRKLGSGFLVDIIGLVITNAHVVTGCSSILIRSYDTRLPANAALLVSDNYIDIAVLHSDALKGMALSLRSSGHLRPGQKVYTIGHPEGLEYTVSDGIVSALRTLKSGRRLIQITAPISPGSSGGPLLDQKGNVVGMTTLYLEEGQNLNFAVTGEDILSAVAGAKVVLRNKPPKTEMAPKPILAKPSSEQLANLARNFRKQKRYGEARTLIDQGAKRYPKNRLILLQQAELSWDEQRYEEAEEYVRQLIEIDPLFPPAHQCRSALLSKRGNWTEARQEAEKALELKPDPEYTAAAHSILTKCALKEGNIDDALFHVKKVLEYDEAKTMPRARAEHAIILKLAKRDSEANLEAIEALRLAPSDEDLKKDLKKYGLPVGAQVISQDASWDYLGNLVVRGVVKNQGTVELSHVQVVTESFDDSGVVVATGYATVTPLYLKPGMTGSFEIQVRGNPMKGKKYQSRIAE
jgi:tetratricopeptide (TPR) repeat protein